MIDKHQRNYPNIIKVIDAVWVEFDVNTKDIRRSSRGRGCANIPRWAALNLCRELSQATPKAIAVEFGMRHISVVSSAAYKLQMILDENDLVDES